MFLDAGENLSDEVAIDTGFPIRQKPSKELAHKHIVYKRKQDVQEDAYSDYGKYDLLLELVSLRRRIKLTLLLSGLIRFKLKMVIITRLCALNKTKKTL